MRASLSATFFACAALMTLAATANAQTTYALDLQKSSLTFTFVQAGARSQGAFRKFDVTFAPGGNDAAAGKLSVVIDIDSLDTRDQERDDTLRSPDLFDVAKFPQARFTSTKLTPSGANRYVVQGRLTIRGVTRNIELPLTFTTKPEDGRTVGYMKGETTIRRLDFGVGQGDWQSTEWVGNDVTVSFNLRLVPQE